MSDADSDSVVMVQEHSEDIFNEPDLLEEDDHATALQIVSIETSSEDKHAFAFHKTKLQSILIKIPPHYKVAVVSVVGAFRTGKSFLLSWFLRYLDSRSAASLESSASGDLDEKQKWYHRYQSVGNDGFDWRAGSERNTTGIWMWSQPHLTTTEAGEPLAVLLVDTQGMFDHETNMALTASIFGFSTLLSSYQIYNVDKRIQEDNLQHLALFSEYARTAVTQEEKSSEAEKESETDAKKPFQQIEFLVRDWQHFDQDMEDAKDYLGMEESMKAYLQTVLSERQDKDLKDTRDQITGCFENISCYGLVHPGFAATKSKFTGNVKDLEADFVSLLDRYCVKVFGSAVQPKIIHGRELTATELGPYIEAYAALFTSGDSFPEAATMLEATVTANNTNAVHLTEAKYKELMDRISGPKSSTYLKPEELDEEHEKALKESLVVSTCLVLCVCH
jgi:atlastin